MESRLVLIADDAEDNRAVFAAALEHFGFSVLHAVNGREGVALATRHTPDLILLDLQMPVMDGWEAARELKENPITAAVPVLAVSAFDLVREPERLRRAGFCGYLRKPVAPRELHAAVRRCLAESAPGLWIEFDRESPDLPRLS